MLKIVNVPNAVLTTPVKPVKEVDAYIKKLIKDMEETLDAQVDPQGVGLAATQVGLSLALFITKPSAKSKVEVFINPKIVELGPVAEPIKKSELTLDDEEEKSGSEENEEEETKLEGCLSIPRIWSPVNRSKSVLLEYVDENGEKKQQKFRGFKAVIIQHEVDHLHGILFTQRSVEQNAPVYEEKNGELKRMKIYG